MMKDKIPAIFMVVENTVSTDSRLKKEIRTLETSYRIVVLGLKGKGEKFTERIGNVRHIRISHIPNFNCGKMIYILQYAYITLISVLVMMITCPFFRYKVIHVHNPPDTFFLLGAFGKLLGIKFVFDLHDLSPELYLARFSGKAGKIHGILKILEKYSCNLANAVITTNESYKKVIKGRHGLPDEKIFIVRNDPDLREFDYSSVKSDARKPKDKILMLYVGSINPQDGAEFLIDIAKNFKSSTGISFLIRVLGSGDSLDDVMSYAAEEGVEDCFEFTGHVGDRKVVMEHLAAADICLEPAPSNPVNDHSTFIKIMEYMAAGKPFVAFDLNETRFTADGSGVLVKANDREQYIESVKKLIEDKKMREELGLSGKNRIKNTLNWENASKILREAYSSMAL